MIVVEHEVADDWGGDEAGGCEDVGDGIDVLAGGQGEKTFFKGDLQGPP
jgi:hypothetical protein